MSAVTLPISHIQPLAEAWEDMCGAIDDCYIDLNRVYYKNDLKVMLRGLLNQIIQLERFEALTIYGDCETHRQLRALNEEIFSMLDAHYLVPNGSYVDDAVNILLASASVLSILPASYAAGDCMVIYNLLKTDLGTLTVPKLHEDKKHKHNEMTLACLELIQLYRFMLSKAVFNVLQPVETISEIEEKKRWDNLTVTQKAVESVSKFDIKLFGIVFISTLTICLYLYGFLTYAE